MNRDRWIIVLMVIGIIAFFVLNKCSSSPSAPGEEALDTKYQSFLKRTRDSVIQVVRAENDTLQAKRDSATKSAGVAIEYVDRWHKVKGDTVGVPYLQVTNNCDSTINKLQAAYNDLCDETNQCYEVNYKQNIVIEKGTTLLQSKDSTITDLKKEVKTERKWKWFWVKTAAVEGAAIAGQAILR